MVFIGRGQGPGFLANYSEIIVSKEQKHYLYTFWTNLYAFGTCLHAIINILRHYRRESCLKILYNSPVSISVNEYNNVQFPLLFSFHTFYVNYLIIM